MRELLEGLNNEIIYSTTTWRRYSWYANYLGSRYNRSLTFYLLGLFQRNGVPCNNYNVLLGNRRHKRGWIMENMIYGYDLNFVAGLLIIWGLLFFMGLWTMSKHIHEFTKSKTHLTKIFINSTSTIQAPILVCIILLLSFICISLTALWAVGFLSNYNVKYQTIMSPLN